VTRIDFYVQKQISQTTHEHLICKITEKAWQNQHEIFLLCTNTEQVNRLDELLWTFSSTSFIPHSSTCDDGGQAVILSTEKKTLKNYEILINLTHDVPEYAGKFSRVIESTGYNEAMRENARKKYKYYKDRGYPLFTHEIGKT
jgi:DNA polymerase-3 subunit chi